MFPRRQAPVRPFSLQGESLGLRVKEEVERHAKAMESHCGIHDVEVLQQSLVFVEIDRFIERSERTFGFPFVVSAASSTTRISGKRHPFTETNYHVVA